MTQKENPAGHGGAPRSNQICELDDLDIAANRDALKECAKELRFEYLTWPNGELERMLDTAAAARDEFAGMGFSSAIVFRPGPHWLRRSRAKLRVAS